MGNTDAMYQELIGKILTGAFPAGASRIEIAKKVDENGLCITVIIRTQQKLSELMRFLPEFQYPCHLLLNNWLMYSHVAKHVKHGSLKLAESELMWAAVIGVAQGEGWGTYVDTSKAIFHVPVGDFSKDFKKIKNPTPSELWTMALLVTDWPGLPEKEPGNNIASLQVVHVPDKPNDRLTENELRRIVHMTLGWNYARFASSDYFVVAAQRLRNTLATATVVRSLDQ